MKTNGIEYVSRIYESPKIDISEMVAEKGVCASGIGGSVNPLSEDDSWGSLFNE